MGPNPQPFAEAYLYYRDYSERNLKIVSFIDSIINKHSYDDFFITRVIDPYSQLLEKDNMKVDVKAFTSMLAESLTNTDKLDFALTVVRQSFIEVWSFNDINRNKSRAGVHFYSSNMNKCNKCKGIGCSYYGLYDYKGEQFSRINTLKYFKHVKFDALNVFGQVTKSMLGFKLKKKGYLLGKPFFNLINVLEYIFRMDELNGKEITNTINNLSKKEWRVFDSQAIVQINKVELKVYLSNLINNGDFSLIEKLLKKGIKSKKLLLL